MATTAGPPSAVDVQSLATIVLIVNSSGKSISILDPVGTEVLG